jgi:hypothetical protein
MHRTLILLFRRDPERDGMHGKVPVEGYQISWPGGRPVALGLKAFCKHGLRLLGLKGCLNGWSERLVELLCFPITDREANMTRRAGHRVRRFCLTRLGALGRLHFLDNSPTQVVFDLDRDDPAVLDWIGLPALREGGRQWIDLAARGLGADLVRTELRTSCGNEVVSFPGWQHSP